MWGFYVGQVSRFDQYTQLQGTNFGEIFKSNNYVGATVLVLTPTSHRAALVVKFGQMGDQANFHS